MAECGSCGPDAAQWRGAVNAQIDEIRRRLDSHDREALDMRRVLGDDRRAATESEADMYERIRAERLEIDSRIDTLSEKVVSIRVQVAWYAGVAAAIGAAISTFAGKLLT